MTTPTHVARSEDAPAITPRRGRFRTIHLAYLGGGLFVVAVLLFNVFQPIRVLPRMRLAPGFSFRNQAGQRRTSEDYRGKVTFYTATCTRCGPEATAVTARLKALRRRIGEAGPKSLSFALVSISVDPANDAPDSLVATAGAEAGDAVSWDHLSGDPVRTKLVVGGGLNIYYKDPAGSAADVVVLEPQVVLVDGWGIVRAQYRGDRFDVDRALRDVGYLADEVRYSRGVGRLAYEAAHLFRCYP